MDGAHRHLVSRGWAQSRWVGRCWTHNKRAVGKCWRHKVVRKGSERSRQGEGRWAHRPEPHRELAGRGWAPSKMAHKDWGHSKQPDSYCPQSRQMDSS